MGRSTQLPAKIKPRKAKPAPANPDTEDLETTDIWNLRLKRARYEQIHRDNLVAEGKLIEADEAIKACGDVVRQIWLLASNLPNTVPARCDRAPAEAIRQAIISELNTAKVAADRFLKKLER